MPVEGHIIIIAMIIFILTITLLCFFTGYPHKMWEDYKYIALEPDEKSFTTDLKIGSLIFLSLLIILYIATIIKTC